MISFVIHESHRNDLLGFVVGGVDPVSTPWTVNTGGSHPDRDVARNGRQLLFLVQSGKDEKDAGNGDSRRLREVVENRQQHG